MRRELESLIELGYGISFICLAQTDFNNLKASFKSPLQVISFYTVIIFHQFPFHYSFLFFTISSCIVVIKANFDAKKDFLAHRMVYP